MTVKKIHRYPDEDLKIFKLMIEKKLQEAIADNSKTQDKVDNLKESMENDFNWVEDSGMTIELEMLFAILNRNQKHINDLENALIRIKNKTYGICVLTGQLIDKRRLAVVPTTTKSIQAKNNQNKTPLTKRINSFDLEKKDKAPITFSRIIKTNSPSSIKKEKAYDEDLLADNFDDILNAIESNEEE